MSPSRFKAIDCLATGIDFSGATFFEKILAAEIATFAFSGDLVLSAGAMRLMALVVKGAASDTAAGGFETSSGWPCGKGTRVVRGGGITV